MLPEEIEKLLSLVDSSDPETKRGAIEVVKKLLGDLENENKKLSELDHAKLLPLRHEAYKSKNQFKAGQLVIWKEGLQNKRVPKPNQPAIVVEILEKPIFDEERQVGSTYFREQLDIILGILNKDGNFLTFYFDSRRFKPL